MAIKNIKFRIEGYMPIKDGLTPKQEVSEVLENLGSDLTSWISKDSIKIVKELTACEKSVQVECPNCGEEQLDGDNDFGFTCLSCKHKFFLEDCM